MNSRNERRTRNTMKLLAWLQDFSPEMYAAVIERVGEAPPPGGLSSLSAAWDMLYPSLYYTNDYQGRWHTHPPGNVGATSAYLSGLGQNGWDPSFEAATETTDDAWWREAIDAVKQAGVAYLQWDAQKDIIAMQTERIKQGKEPLDTAVVAPTVRHQVDIPADMRREIQVMGQGVMTWAILGGVGLLAFMLLRR